MTLQGRALLAGWLAATAAAPAGGAAGGLLCAVVLWLATVGILPGETLDASLVPYGLRVGLWPIMPLVPAVLLGARLATRGLARRRSDKILGWVGFAAAGAFPYLAVPGYDSLPLGLCAGIACAWAFAKAESLSLRRGAAGAVPAA